MIELVNQHGCPIGYTGKKRKLMKIKIEEKGKEIGIAITKKQTCPAGTAYWQIDYLYRGICIHSAGTGAIWGNPNPIEMLDRKFTVNQYHYQDIPTPDPQPVGKDYEGRTIKVGSSDGRPCWWEEVWKTHRQAIIESLEQIVDPNEFELDQLQDQFEEFLDEKTGGCNRGWCTRCKFEPVCQGQEVIV
jgi:hypothetical protein